MLRVRGIEHHYGARRVLDIESLDFETGSATAVVGANGSGKSTLLRILAFLETPTNGSLVLDGNPIRTRADRLAARRIVTLVEQRPFLFSGTVTANMLYGLRARGCRGSEAKRRVAEALQLTGVADLADRDARALSEGEVQKIAVARALSLDPKVLLLDEPTSAADRSSTNRLYQIVAEARDRGVTVVIASHRLEEVYRWSENFVSLDGGRTSPVSPENIFRVEIPAGTGSKEVRLGDLVIHVVTDTTGPATIALPPDDLIVSSGGFSSSARNQFQGRIQRISEDGRGRVTLRIDAGVELVARITPSALADLALSVGSPVILSIKAMAVRVF